jgi:hypothetical protein
MLKDAEEIMIQSTYVKLVQGSSKRVYVNDVTVAFSHRHAMIHSTLFHVNHTLFAGNPSRESTRDSLYDR